MGVRSGRMRGKVVSRDVVLGTPGGFLKQRGNANNVEQRVASTSRLPAKSLSYRLSQRVMESLSNEVQLLIL